MSKGVKKSDEERRISYNAYKAALYNDRKRWGVCPICGKPLGEGVTTICCPDCLAKRKKWASTHKTNSKEASRKFRERHKALGLCVFCNAPAEEGRTLCTFHREYTREKQRRKKACK